MLIVIQIELTSCNFSCCTENFQRINEKDVVRVMLHNTCTGAPLGASRGNGVLPMGRLRNLVSHTHTHCEEGPAGTGVFVGVVGRPLPCRNSTSGGAPRQPYCYYYFRFDRISNPASTDCTLKLTKFTSLR